MAVLANNTCTNVLSCQGKEGKALSVACAKANKTAERWRAEAMTLDHMECLLRELATGHVKAVAVKACGGQASNASTVNITCPPVAASDQKLKCERLVMPADVEVVPGAAKWVKTQYHEKPM